MEVEIAKHNQKAYEAARRMIERNGVAAVVHPMLSNINEIGIKFLSETQGKTICVENRSSIDLEGIKKREEGFREVEYITYLHLLNEIKEGKQLTGYKNILLIDLQMCNENVWKDGIEVLLNKNKDAKVLELVEFSIMFKDVNNSTFRRIKGNVASFLSEEEATKQGITSPMAVDETRSIERELGKDIKKINNLKDKTLQKILKQKVVRIKALSQRLKNIYPKTEETFETIWRNFINDREDGIDTISEEEFQDNVNRDLEMLELQNTIRKLLREIGEALGEKYEDSELESLKEEYIALSEKEEEAKKLLKEVRESKAKEKNDKGER